MNYGMAAGCNQAFEEYGDVDDERTYYTGPYQDGCDYRWCPTCSCQLDIRAFARNPRGFSSECKSCKSERELARYQANPEEMRRRKRTSSRAVYRRDPEAVKARLKRWRRKNLSRVRGYRKKWKQRNPARWHAVQIASSIVRRARRYNAPGNFTADDIATIYNWQDGLCYYCGVDTKGRFAMDHMIPLSRGGSNYPSNLVVACRPCNLRKHAMMADEFTALLKAESSAVN